MRVALIGYFHGYGGAEKQLILLANELSKMKYDVYLIALAANNYCYPLEEKINVIEIPESATKIAILYRYIGLFRALKRIKPDLSVNFWFQSAYFETLMSKRYTGNIIYAERGDPGDEEYSGVLGFIRKCVIHRIDGFVFQTKAAQAYFNDKVINRSVIIPNPVAINVANEWNSNRDKRIVNIGRLHPQKNQILLIEAFKIVHRKFPDYSLEIYGDGELKDEIQNTIDRLDLQGCVFLKGTHNNIHDLIKSASVFVLSSDFEGLPNALIEAMILGLPCISTDCKPGGAKEIITNGKNGIIVPRKDVNALADAILNLIENKDLSEALSRNAKKIKERYDSETIFKKWDSFIKAVKKQETMTLKYKER